MPLAFKRKGAPQNFGNQGSIGRVEFAKAANDLVLGEDGQLGDANSGGRVQASCMPSFDGDIEL
jgi:hypothetical protein